MKTIYFSLCIQTPDHFRMIIKQRDIFTSICIPERTIVSTSSVRERNEDHHEKKKTFPITNKNKLLYDWSIEKNLYSLGAIFWSITNFNIIKYNSPVRFNNHLYYIVPPSITIFQ